MSVMQELFLRLKTSRAQKLFDAPLLSEPAGRALPRTVWMFWAQGLADAPPVVRLCHESWVTCNPGWEVRMLDRDSAAELVDLGDLDPEIPLQTLADLLRLRLLKTHGGVWADATLYCTTPLDHWLHLVLPTGSFFFQRPRPERVMANWFMAARPGAPLIAAIEEAASAYWQGRKSAEAYFWFHFTVEYLVRTDRALRRDFEAMPRLGATAPLRLQRYLRGKDSSPPDLRGLPMHKLTWKDARGTEEIRKVLDEFG